MPLPEGHRRVRCPACEKRYAVRLEDITEVGAEITCPHCAHAFVVFPADDPTDDTGEQVLAGGLTLPPQPVQIRGEVSATPAPKRRQHPAPSLPSGDWNPKAATQVPAQRHSAPARSEMGLAVLAAGSAGLGLATLCVAVVVAWLTLRTDESSPVSGTLPPVPTGLPSDAP